MNAAASSQLHRLLSTGAAHGTLNTYLVTDTAGLKRLRPSWEHLQAEAQATNPFTQWEWVWNWWRLFGGSSRLLKHRLHILVLQDGAVVRAIFPFVLTTVGFGPWAVRTLQLYGFNGSFTEMRAPMVWPGWERQAARSLWTALRRQRHLYHWCSIDGIPADNSLGKALVEGSQRAKWTVTHAEPCYILPLPSSWDELRTGLKRNIKQSLRHCYNSLAREEHTWRFEVVSDPRSLPSALDEFFKLHRMRSKMPDSVPHRDNFSTRRRRLFLKQMGRALAPRNRFMVARLRVNGEVVASRILLPIDGCLYLYYSGFDPAWKKYSVMTTLTAECIKMAIAQGFETVNFSPGTDVSKTRWGPQVETTFGLRIPSPTPVGRLLFAARQHLPVRRFAMPERKLPEPVGRE